MKKPAAHARSRKHKRRKGDTGQLAAQLAPLEELDRRAAEKQIGTDSESTQVHQQRDYGAIVVDNVDLNVPKEIIGDVEDKKILGMEPVVLVVLIIMLAFIAFITWQISLMPAR